MSQVSFRVLILSNALAGGGAERVARDMLENISNSACVLFENEHEVEVHGKKIWVACSRKSGTLFGKTCINLWRLVFIQLIKIRYRPTVTISHLEGPNFANLLSFGGGKKIIFVHNALSHSYRQRSKSDLAKSVLARLLYRHAFRVVGVSPFIREELEKVQKINPRKVLFLANPINIANIQTAAAEEQLGGLGKLATLEYIICVGSLTTQKNHELALKVFKALLRERRVLSNLKLVILGEGPLLGELKRFGASLGLAIRTLDTSTRVEDADWSADVFFVGFQTNPYPLMRHAQAFLMTSKWEGLPISILESLALGVPVVVSDCSSSIGLVMQSNEKSDQNQKAAAAEQTECGRIIFGRGESREEIEIWRESLEGVLRDARVSLEMHKKCLEAAKQFDVSRIKKDWDSRLLSVSAK